MRMVLRQGLTMSAAGVAIGLTGAVFLTRLLEQMLYGVTRLDPATFVAVPALLAIVALIACLQPGPPRRLARSDRDAPSVNVSVEAGFSRPDAVEAKR